MESAQADTLTGRMLDRRYHVRSRIAHGGMATVYLATDTRLEREVALKVMHAELARDADFVGRFIGEAKSVAKLSHPNIVGVYDQGSDGQYLYLAMEYVPGRTLRALLRERGWLPWQEALGLMDPILAGLAAAHQAGIVHRDVKPENVLITADGRVKVVDFGLARASAAASNTRAGMIIGSVAYLAPEQVTGAVTDARTDVYAAGVLLFEMLTGRQPFTGETPLALAYAHVNSDVPVVSSVVGGIPPSVDQLVQAATSRDPGWRPGDAGVFLRVTRSLRGIPETPDSLSGAWATPSTPAAPSVPATPGPYGGGTGSRTMVVQHQAGYGTDYVEDQQGAFKSAFAGLLRGNSADGGEYPPAGIAGMHDEGEPFLQRWLFSRKFVYVASAAVILAAIGGGGWYLTSGRYTPVPSIDGQPLASAEQALRQAGFQVQTGTSVNSNSVQSGDVISTSPSGKALPGAMITVNVSLGPRMIRVPAIPTTDSVAQATAALHAAGLTVSATTKPVGVPSNPQIGTVAGTDPASGTLWPQTKAVSIEVVAGLSLPNLVGQDEQTVANQWAAQNGITITPTTVSSNQPAGIIVKQSPAPGTPVRSGQAVNVEVSAGPPEVQIPGNLVGQRFSDVRRQLEQLGFKVAGKQYLFGQKVFSVSPTGEAPAGSTINVYYGGF